MSSDSRRLWAASLLFCSGLCALVYQTVWLREFRLIFGASTAASAAVLGIFMGGLGLGSAWLGHRAEASSRPLFYYGKLEFFITLAASATPFLLSLGRQLYILTGGSMVMGHTLATIVQLLLSALVLIVPTFLMGGTLPAVARFVSSHDDLGRRHLALLYGCNTLGAVTGAALTTFWLVEHLGNRGALWAAGALNLLVALTACRNGRQEMEIGATESTVPSTPSTPAITAAAPRNWIMVSAALVGFAFMLMEIVWYRMLGPILGGSTFTFGLILIVALLGIGLGGAVYALRGAEQPASVSGFALTCGLEAFFIALPFALGDRLASLALMLRPLGSLGFGPQVLGWGLVTAIVVLPAAFIAGYQFPLLIGLMGRGRTDVAKHTGQAYAANTLGAIVGSLAGGFGLLPLLTAPGVWKLVAILLALLAIATLLLSRPGGLRPWLALSSAVGALFLLSATGPTAVWRHGGIGAGRADSITKTPNGYRAWAEDLRRNIVWEAEGVESSVGLLADSAYSFVVNGKVDGNSRLDAPTQIMSSMIGALLHPNPKRAMVIGLGTGSSAGWLGQIPSMEQVDAVELEPAIAEVAKRCAPVNCDVLNQPKVHLHFGDAREALLTAPRRYDIIFSEPSNPYRAGIASLYTYDFYHAAEQRLEKGGIFLQWVQAYSIDADGLQTVFATLGSVFPSIQVWTTEPGDLILIATRETLPLDADTLRARIAQEPMRAALDAAWRVDSLEGVFSHFVAGEGLCDLVRANPHPIATDDRNRLEFGFARTVGHHGGDLTREVGQLARQHGVTRPRQLTGAIDWDRASAQEPIASALTDAPDSPTPDESPLRRNHREFLAGYLAKNQPMTEAAIRHPGFQALNPLEIEAVADVLASHGDDNALPLIERVAKIRPGDAEAIRGRYLAQKKDFTGSTAAYIRAFQAWQQNPWARPRLAAHSLDSAVEMARAAQQPALTKALLETLATPFAVDLVRQWRLSSRVNLARQLESTPEGRDLVLQALAPYEKNPVWTRDFLVWRAHTYVRFQDPLATSAALDVREFLDQEPIVFGQDLPIPPRPSPLGKN